MNKNGFQVTFPLNTDGEVPFSRNILVRMRHVELHRMIKNLIGRAQAESNPELQQIDVISIVVYSAFYVEAAANFLLEQRIDSGSELDKRRWKDKLQILIDEFDCQISFGCAPLQNVVEAFKIRDDFAHAKFEVKLFADSVNPIRDLRLIDATRIFAASHQTVATLWLATFGTDIGIDFGSFTVSTCDAPDVLKIDSGREHKL